MKTTPQVSIKSAGASMENAGIFKQEKRNRWEMSRTVPNSVLVDRAKEERKREVQAMKDSHNAKRNPTLGIHAEKTEGGFKVLGFGMVVATQEELFTLAKEYARAFVKVDGIQI